MDFLPLFLTVRDRRAVVIGGGAVAARKAELLIEAGAKVHVVAPSLSAELKALLDAGRISYRLGAFAPSDLDDAAVIIAATDVADVNAAAAKAGRSRGIPINVVDNLELSTFILPAIVDRSPVLVAIGTSGTSPVLARFVREKIEALLSPQLGKLAALAGRWRSRVKKSLGTVLERRRFWERVFEGPVATHALSGREEQAEFELRRELKRAVERPLPNPPPATGGGDTASSALAPSLAERGRVGEGASTTGEVYLVGAGPGDPDLLTLKAARLLQRADVVLYDRLVSKEVLARARRDAELIYVGKEAGQHHVTQDHIQQLLVELALKGNRVCRLKGGDPFVFGRGGEELEALIAHNIPFTVVPGITAALGAAAYAGIPLTHRDHAQAVTFVTGHTRDGSADADWRDLSRAGQTAVFYMGLSQLPNIVAELTAAGAPLSRPAAVIERATYPDQRVIEGTLETLAARVEAAKVQSPALLIVGDVVALRASLTTSDAVRRPDYFPKEQAHSQVKRA